MIRPRLNDNRHSRERDTVWWQTWAGDRVFHKPVSRLNFHNPQDHSPRGDHANTQPAPRMLTLRERYEIRKQQKADDGELVVRIEDLGAKSEISHTRNVILGRSTHHHSASKSQLPQSNPLQLNSPVERSRSRSSSVSSWVACRSPSSKADAWDATNRTEGEFLGRMEVTRKMAETTTRTMNTAWFQKQVHQHQQSVSSNELSRSWTVDGRSVVPANEAYLREVKSINQLSTPTPKRASVRDALFGRSVSPVQFGST